jgi:hypothetical protein
VRFERQFHPEDETIRIVDRIRFRRRLRFATFTPVAIGLFPDTPVVESAADRRPDRLCLAADGIRLTQIGRLRSSTGDAVLWDERLEDVCFRGGDELARTYRFCLPQTTRREARGVTNTNGTWRAVPCGRHTECACYPVSERC